MLPTRRRQHRCCLLWLSNKSYFILEILSQSTVRVKSGRLKWIFGNVSVYTFSKLWSDMYFWVRICINYSQHIMLVDVIRTSSERNQVWIYTNRTFAVFQKPKIHHSLFLRMRIHWNDELIYQDTERTYTKVFWAVKIKS